MIRLSARKQLNPGGPTPYLDLQLTVDHNDHLGVIGPSGAGKTTLLKILAGLIEPDAGKLYVDGEPWFDAEKGIHLPPQKRNIGFVFQEYALFPNMTVQENLEFAFSDGVNQPQLNATIEMLSISSILNQKPATLSGGQKQRVALGRALLRNPNLLLLDEPLSALDPKMRNGLQQDLIRISSNFDGTMILVSHDPAEIIQLADRAIVLEKGEIIQTGPATKLLKSHTTQHIKPGIVEVIDILSDEQVLIAKSHHGLVHLPFDLYKNPDLQVGDTVSVTLEKSEIEKVLS